MFFDFSSAFNTMQCHLLVDKLLTMNVDFRTILWIFDYLTFRPQFVRLRNSFRVFNSEITFTNTGAPQGTVLAPFLFSLYTADHRQTHSSCPLIKFADDTALSGLISDNDDVQYKNEISDFVNWCDMNYLDLNVGKTKEMIIDFRKENKVDFEPIVIKDESVEKVSKYKYLGMVIDDKLSWKENCDYIYKRTQTRMFCLKKLRSFNVNSDILQIFYSSVISSIMSFGITCWGGNMTETDKQRVNKQIRRAGRIVGREQDDLETMYSRQLTKKLTSVLADSTHPLYPEFDSRRVERSGRFRAPAGRTDRYRHSFIPTAIQAHNKQLGRQRRNSH